MNSPMKRKNALIVPETQYGTCLWELPEGGLLASEPGVFLSIEGPIGSPRAEKEIEDAARYWLSAGKHDYVGKPYWIRGIRKVTDSERDDMEERLRDGHIPDWEEEVRISMQKDKGGR